MRNMDLRLFTSNFDIHNTMVDAISWLEYTPTKHKEPLSIVFANRSKEDEIYPLTIKEIAKALCRIL